MIRAQLAAECHFVWIKTLLALTFCCSSSCCGPGLAPGMDVTSFSLFYFFFFNFFFWFQKFAVAKLFARLLAPSAVRAEFDN